MKFFLLCEHCEKWPAVCVGSYEGATESMRACDECCAHGCEDGYCEPLESSEQEPN